MNLRNLLFLFLLSGAVALQAQDFVTLDWMKNQSSAALPDFEGSVRCKDSKLPCYAHVLEVGRDFRSFLYEVRVEYPEYRELTGRESETLDRLDEKPGEHPEVKTSLGIAAKNGLLEVRFTPLVCRGGKYFKLISFKLALYKTPCTKSFAPDREAVYTSRSVLSRGKWVKIKVTGDGVYRMTDRELSAMGFAKPSKVRLYGYGGRLLPEKVGEPVVDDLQEIPLWRENGFVLFYAYGTIRWTPTNPQATRYVHRQNHYSTGSFYFLTESDQEPEAFPVENSLPADGAVRTSVFPDYVLHEKEEFSWMKAGQMFFEEYDYKLNPKKSYTLRAPGIVGSRTDTLDFSFSAASKKVATYAEVDVNGSRLGKLFLKTTSEAAVVKEASYNLNLGKQEQVTVTVTHDRPAGVSGHLDYIRLNYSRALHLSDSYLKFRGPSGKLNFVLSGANAQTRIWEVTEPGRYRQIEGVLSGDSYSFTVENDPGKEYVAVNTKGSFSKVEVVGDVPNQNLHELKGVDMLVIVPPVRGLMDQAERLAQAHRRKDGLNVTVVTSEQVYNEFSSGTPDATAYRNLMKMLYDRSTTEEVQPKYLLLFGDAIWDNRMVTSTWRKSDPRNFLLCYESKVSVANIESYVLEDYFGFLDMNEGVNPQKDKLDIGIGRIPVRSAEEAEKVVDKTIDYLFNRYAGAWKNATCFLGDDQDNLDHVKGAQYMAEGVEKNHPELLVKKIYWNSYDRVTTASGVSYPGAHKEAIEQMRNGALVMIYSGHANPEGLSHERVLTIKDIKETNTTRLPFWLTMGCDAGPFDSGEESFGKELILNAKGGAIGALTSTRSTYGNKNQLLGRKFLEYALAPEEGKTLRVGDALRKAKYVLVDEALELTQNKLQYVLLGDPAISLSDYVHRAVIDRIDGKPASEGGQIKAGGVVSVEGYIADGDGNFDETFNGIIYPTVMDHLEELKTLGTDGTDPYSYQARTKKLFTGSDSIRSGRFRFTFPVPMDISYSNESGLLNLYALDRSTDREARGSYDGLLVGGTQDGSLSGDSQGPKIYMYLNSPDFPYGGEVNATPLLVAELEDEDGINAVGNGIGHDLTAIIDNSYLLYYVLNDYYANDFGTYTKGAVRFSIPRLPEGKHHLELRAWDLKNNSSVSELEFYVNNSLRPGLDVSCVGSDGYRTAFIISHDRPESPVDLKIEVCDCSGKILWTHDENIQSADPVYSMEWDMTDNSGRRLQPGVYLYRVYVSSNGSQESTQAKKLVVFNRL